MAPAHGYTLGLIVSLLVATLSTARESSNDGAFKIDMLQVFRSGETIKGVSDALGSHVGTLSYRVRPSLPILTLPASAVQELRNHDSNALSLIITAKQVYESAGTLLTITTADNSPWLMLSTNLRTGLMRLKYRNVNENALREVLTSSPFIETDLQEWAQVGIVLSGTSMKIYEGCTGVKEVLLEEGAINLRLPEESVVYVVQGLKGKNKFSGWIEEFWLYPSELTTMPWTCPDIEEAPSNDSTIAPHDTQSDAQGDAQGGAPSDTSHNTPSTSHTNPTVHSANATTSTASDSSQGMAADVLSDEAPMESPALSALKDAPVFESKAAFDQLVREGLPNAKAAQTAADWLESGCW